MGAAAWLLPGPHHPDEKLVKLHSTHGSRVVRSDTLRHQRSGVSGTPGPRAHIFSKYRKMSRNCRSSPGCKFPSRYLHRRDMSIEGDFLSNNRSSVRESTDCTSAVDTTMHSIDNAYVAHAGATSWPNVSEAGPSENARVAHRLTWTRLEAPTVHANGSTKTNALSRPPRFHIWKTDFCGEPSCIQRLRHETLHSPRWSKPQFPSNHQISSYDATLAPYSSQCVGSQTETRTWLRGTGRHWTVRWPLANGVLGPFGPACHWPSH